MSVAVNEQLFDARLPRLRTIFDPQELNHALRKVLPAHWGPFGECRIQVLQHHRGSRCTVEINLHNSSGNHQVIGKLYAKDRFDVYQAMQLISGAGFGPEAEFSIPQPLGFLPEMNLLLQEKISGTLATEIFVEGTETERLRAAERCASWLAAFHHKAPPSGPRFAVIPELTQYWVRRLAKRAGAQAAEVLDRATLLRERLDLAAAKIDAAELCACHGTYCHYQIILTAGRIVTLDWDGFCLSHPALDLARFIVVLEQLALKTRGSLKAFAVEVKTFSEAYASQARFNLADQLPVYEAAHFLKHAKHHLKHGNGGVRLAQIMLDEGIRVLAEET